MYFYTHTIHTLCEKLKMTSVPASPLNVAAVPASTATIQLNSFPTVIVPVHSVVPIPKPQPKTQVSSVISSSKIREQKYWVGSINLITKGNRVVYNLTGSSIIKATLFDENKSYELGHTYRDVLTDIFRKNNGQVVDWAKPKGHSANNTFKEIVRILKLCKFDLQLIIKEWDGRLLDIGITRTKIRIKVLAKNCIVLD